MEPSPTRASTTSDDRRPIDPGLARVLGPLARFAADGGVTDLFVNAPDRLYVDRGAGPRLDPRWRLPTGVDVRGLAVRLVAAGGRHLDDAEPCVDVRLGAGIRVHAVLPPVARDGAVVSIRLPRPRPFRLADLVAAGALTPAVDARLRGAVAARENLLVTGAAGTGKTALLGALLGCAPADERIVVVEDVAELRPRHPHVVVLEARQPNIEGAGGVGLERLVREALRMRPDRLVLGECRGAELRELLTALNTGHDGGAGTLHANSLADVPARLEAMAALAVMRPEDLARQAVSAFDLVVHLERRGGRRRVAELGVPVLDAAGRLAVRPVEPGGSP